MENSLNKSGTSTISLHGCTTFKIKPLTSIESLKQIDKSANSEFILLIISESEVELRQFAFERISSLARSFRPGIIYSDYFDKDNDLLTQHSLIDYQAGSVRDNFNFGHILFFRKDVFSEATKELKPGYEYAGLYNLRLNISIKYPLVRIPEFLYSATRTSETDKQFDYVDSKNRKIQIELEQVFTEHLKRINAFVKPHFNQLDLYSPPFKTEVSVIIPVKNRVRTISDAVNSAIKQRGDFLLT